MNKEVMHSIILNPWEVRGILDGWLTQLVRPVTPQPEGRFYEEMSKDGFRYLYHGEEIACPFGKPGDVLELCTHRMMISPNGDENFSFSIHPESFGRSIVACAVGGALVERLEDVLRNEAWRRLYNDTSNNTYNWLCDNKKVMEQWNLDHPETPCESDPWVWVATIRKVET